MGSAGPHGAASEAWLVKESDTGDHIGVVPFISSLRESPMDSHRADRRPPPPFLGHVPEASHPARGSVPCPSVRGSGRGSMKAALLGTVVLFCRPALAPGVLGFSDEEAGKQTDGSRGRTAPPAPRGWMGAVGSDLTCPSAGGLGRSERIRGLCGPSVLSHGIPVGSLGIFCSDRGDRPAVALGSALGPASWCSSVREPWPFGGSCFRSLSHCSLLCLWGPSVGAQPACAAFPLPEVLSGEPCGWIRPEVCPGPPGLSIGTRGCRARSTVGLSRCFMGPAIPFGGRTVGLGLSAAAPGWLGIWGERCVPLWTLSLQPPARRGH